MGSECTAQIREWVLPPPMLLLGFRDACPFPLLTVLENQELVTFVCVFREVKGREAQRRGEAYCLILVPLEAWLPLPLGSM